MVDDAMPSANESDSAPGPSRRSSYEGGPRADEPTSKRQRRAPSWLAKDKFLVGDADPTKLVGRDGEWKGDGEGDEDDLAGPSGKPASNMGVKIHDYKVVSISNVSVVVEYQGVRYHGLLRRTGPTPNVGFVLKDHSQAEQSSSNNCALCNLPLDQPCGPPGCSEEDAAKIAKVDMSSYWTAHVHFMCGLWAPEVYEDADKNLAHLNGCIRRGRALRCKHCKERGATLGCYHRGCQSVYHLPCALEASCALEERSFKVWCPSHIPRGLAPAVPKQRKS